MHSKCYGIGFHHSDFTEEKMTFVEGEYDVKDGMTCIPEYWGKACLTSDLLSKFSSWY